MRRTLAILALLILLSLLLSALHPHHRSVGEEFLAALDRPDAPPLRNSLILIEFTPDSQALADAHHEKIERGDGPLPGIGLTPRPDSHWAKTADADFIWQTQPSAIDPLHTALFDPQGDVQQRITRAIHDVGYYNEVAQNALRDALASLLSLSDEALRTAWINADRDILPQRQELAPAVREALLLACPLRQHPVLRFTCRAHHIYILDDDSSPTETWLQLLAYNPAGQLAWTGTLHIKSPPSPDRTRPLAALMADLATPQL